MIARRLCALVATIAFTACSGGGSAPRVNVTATATATPAPSPTPAAPISSAPETVYLVLTIPRTSASALRKRPAYVSPATASVSISVDNAAATIQNLGANSPDCVSAAATYPYTCTVPVTATAGAHTFTIATFDENNAAGKLLSTNSITQTVGGGTSDTIAITLAGVPVSVQVVPVPGSLEIVGSQTGLYFLGGPVQTLDIVTLDADGNYIVGPGSPALAVSFTNASTGSSLAIASVGNGNPNVFTLQSTIELGSANLDITATPTSTLAGNAITLSVPLNAVTLTTTVAGGTAQGFADGMASGATFDEPAGIAYDAANGNAYVTDQQNCAIRSVSAAGIVTTIAGNGASSCGFADGMSTAATFDLPNGLAADSADGNLYVTDSSNCAIRKVTPAGVVTTFAGANPKACGSVDATGTAAEFNDPVGIAYDAANGDFYVTDASNCAIRQITAAAAVTTIAGSATCGNADGTGATARFQQPVAIAYDASDGNLYVGDGNTLIRKVTTAGVVTTVAGVPGGAYTDGTGSRAFFHAPVGLAYDPLDGNIYVTDNSNCAIRRVTPSGVVTTVAAAGLPDYLACGFEDGLGTNSAYNLPNGIAFDSATGDLLITDTGNSAVRELQL